MSLNIIFNFLYESCMPQSSLYIMGPFKCYVMQMGGVCVQFSRKKHYEGVRFNVIGITRDWVGVQFPEKKRYVTVEWPLSDQTNPFEVILLASTRAINLVFQTFPQDQPGVIVDRETPLTHNLVYNRAIRTAYVAQYCNIFKQYLDWKKKSLQQAKEELLLIFE